ncbi:TetR family transcriptional regulator [Actinocorallia longicatena]|uniref:TetR family transcriptional regulator n=1 Tax=Actinocorallia longicatena TaxID=111803 RepID=A0ABP6Q5I3_9ACTN
MTSGMAEDHRKPPMRDLLADAAFELFEEKGFEQTTVDDIVARAGVGRRSFFRYFPSKEDVVFPDHERCLDDMVAFLKTAADGTDLVEHACEATLLVARMYAERPERSLMRYRHIRDVPALRDHEHIVIRRYEHALAAFLREGFAFRPDGPLHAEIIAAAASAAHNHAVRTWLRNGATTDAVAAARTALASVRAAWGAPPTPAEPDDYVVVITRSRAPLQDVLHHVEHALARIAPADDAE